MNVFAVSADPVECARALDDKRLNKMIVESGQILSIVLHLRGRGSPGIYKPAYPRHPVVLWAAADPRNYAWLFRHLEALFAERAFRLETDAHRSRRILPELSRHVESHEAPAAFLNCTPYKALADVHLAYRRTLTDKWRRDVRPPTWRRRRPPDFYPAPDAERR